MPFQRPARTRSAILLVALLTLTSTAGAQLAGEPGSGGPYVPPPPSKDVKIPFGEEPCSNEKAQWRMAQTIEGVSVRPSRQCEPDNPKLVAAFVKGTNHMPQELLDEVGLHRDAVVKEDDRDGDGDPDVIRITLEVSELNGWHLPGDVLAGEGHAIAPGIRPTFWVFNPKTTIHHSGVFYDIARMPSAPIRVEQGDEVHLTVENTHYFPHTVHLHGADHPFMHEGHGNDGVPHISEHPILPGEKKTYHLTPRHPGTFFYHCHVHPHVHVSMGLGTILIVEEERPDNWVQTFNVGAGDVRFPSQAVRERYDREYDLVYQDLDKELSEAARASNDPRVLEKLTHREYDVTDRTMDYFLVNGRSFPYTLRESVIVVAENETVKLRTVNAGQSPVSLHLHGHKPVATHTDGVEIPPEQRVPRDVFTLTAAQRLDLEINTTNDGFHSYGPGLWPIHDHQEFAVTTDGIGKGGDSTLLAYEPFLDPMTSMPVPQAMPLDLYFTEEYYRGEIPVFAGLNQPGIWGEVDEDHEHGAAVHGRETPAPLAPGVLVAVVALAILLRREAIR